MKMKKIFFAVVAIVCLMASCTKDGSIEPNVNPFSGQEVIFSTATEDGSSRTIYGDGVKDVTDGTIVSWYYPIYWKAGDKVAVFGKDCATKQAEYNVTVTSDGTQNYANKLEKTGDAGVQWGDAPTSDFYAVYPSTNASFDANGVIHTTIAQTQYNVFEPSAVDGDGNVDGGWIGQSFDKDATNPTMPHAIMYAYTPGASATAAKVDLNFKPFSTVLKFRLLGFNANLDSDAYVQISKITVTAPAGYSISGDFKITPTADGKATATATNGKNTVEIIPILSGGSYLRVQNQQYVEFDVFTMPLPNQVIAASGNWSIKIETVAHGNYQCTLKPTADKTLAAGKIHKIAVPYIEALNTVSWDYSKWMTQIPTPVYLSELSIPGAWYCMDSGYQNSTDIATLYDAGIRAFNIDCRVTMKDGRYSLLDGNFQWSDSNYEAGNFNFACAGTEKITGINRVYINIAGSQLVSNIVKSICNIAQSHKDELVVIVFTYAEKPSANTTATANVFGSVRPDFITEQLNIVLNTDGIKEYIYTGVDSETSIQDIIETGKNVIVKINHSNVNFATSTSPSFSMPAGHMASFGSMATDGYIQTGVTDIVSGLTSPTSPYYGYYAKMQSYPIYNGKTATGLTYHYHQAQKTSSSETRGDTNYKAVPTLGQRMDAIDNLLEKATEIYDASTHNAWFQIGIGGSIDGSNQSGMSKLNEYLKTQIEAKMASDPSPVGIVLMNHATDANGNPTQLVKDIIEMNGKFYLKRKGGDIITGGGEGGSNNSGSSGSSGSSGNNDGDQGEGD